MRKKYIFQVIQDAVMLLILSTLMGYHLWSEYIHEISGVIFLMFILLHIGLNLHWFRHLFQGEYTVFRILQITLNILLIIVFIAALFSGIMLSQHLFPNLSLHNASDFVRKIHMISVHWGQLLIALHLGLHWKMLANFFCRLWNVSASSMLATYVMPLFFLSISIYGLYAFINRHLIAYLFMQVEFSFFNFEEPKTLFYADIFSIIIFIAYLTRYLLWLFLFREKQRFVN
jgi:hypothetical protein